MRAIIIPLEKGSVITASMDLMCALFVLSLLGGSIEASISSQFVDGSSVVLFESPLSDRQVQDVLESILYAQKLATHYYSKFESISDWYRTNLEYLQNVGWLMDVSSFDFSYFNSSLALKDLISRTLESKLDADQLSLLQNSLTELYLLNSSQALQILKNESTKGSLQVFQIALVRTTDSDGSLCMIYFGVVIDVFNQDNTQLFISSGLGFLNEKDYALYRNETSLFVKNYFFTSVVKY